MRKILLILFMIMLLGMSAVNGQVIRGGDLYSDGVRISSNTSIDYPVDNMSLIKIMSSGMTEYSFSAKVTGSKDFSLTKSFLEIKIDNNPSRNIEVKEGSLLPATNNKYMVSSSITVPLSSQFIDELRIARRVALKFQTAGGYTTILVLPDSVLAEWQQVINTEK